VFRRDSYILNTKVYLKKFNAKSQKCIILGYFECSKANKVYNSETILVEESIYMYNLMTKSLKMTS